ncbi:hypothetical protein [Qipengyuania flava]|uniref:hypothetical protein n=1 Tax=Qipengyuania flava TaxID=192812 RepID=UPI001C62D41F|nr:hypothetical protein [Qipengyuania flava]QYJ08259.1 hypothetical protein KUV82_06050 [Qipengyuania flava]
MAAAVLCAFPTAALSQPNPEPAEVLRAQMLDAAKMAADDAEQLVGPAREAFRKCDFETGHALQRRLRSRKAFIEKLDAIADDPTSYAAPIALQIAAPRARAERADKSLERSRQAALFDCYETHGDSYNGYDNINGISAGFQRLELIETLLPILDPTKVFEGMVELQMTEVCYAINRYEATYERLRRIVYPDGAEATELSLEFSPWQLNYGAMFRPEFDKLKTPDDLRVEHRCPR